MIERKIVSNVYGEEVITPLSEREYQSIKWDWQIMVEEIEAEADSISSLASSVHMMETMSMLATPEQLAQATRDYDKTMEKAFALYDKADKIRNARKNNE